MRVTVLGSRGSTPVSGREYEQFGGNTSCSLVEADGQAIFLDAGTGIVRAPCSFLAPPTILLSHLHIDHVLGLGMYRRLAIPGTQTRLYATLDRQTVLEVLNRLYSPPLWPLTLAEYAGNLEVRSMPQTLHVGNVVVQSIEGNHPGGGSVFRLCHRGKVLVYATDYEYEPASFERLAEFAYGADLILFDAQYDDAELDAYKGFGHSSPRIGLDLMEQSGARRMLLIHHDPGSTDEVLTMRERRLDREDVRFAREGEVVQL